MKLIVGLGNPGNKYADNRHNIGFMAVDAIHDRHGFSPWRKRFRGQTAEGTIAGGRVLLLKPETFMNESGRAVGEAARFLKIKPGDVIVLHDELDLAPGKIRTKVGGGHAGHNGLRSTEQHIGKAFARIRLGIGHPGHKDRVAGYVLHDFAKADRDWLDPLIDAIAAEASWLAAGDLERFQTAVSQARLDGKTSERSKVSGTGAVPARPGGGGPGRGAARGGAGGGQGRTGDGAGPRRPSQLELAARSARGADPKPKPKRQPAEQARTSDDAPPPEPAAPKPGPKTAFGEKLSGVFSKLMGRDPK